jgi:hypothetical protein
MTLLYYKAMEAFKKDAERQKKDKLRIEKKEC